MMVVNWQEKRGRNEFYEVYQPVGRDALENRSRMSSLTLSLVMVRDEIYIDEPI